MGTQFENCTKLFGLLSELEEEMNLVFDITEDPLSISQKLIGKLEKSNNLNEKEEELVSIARKIIRDRNNRIERVIEHIEQLQSQANNKSRIYRIK